MKVIRHYRLLMATTLAIVPASLFSAPSVLDDAPRSVTTPQSIKVNLETDDFLEAVAGIKDKYFAKPVEGRFGERIERKIGFATLGIEGIDYALSVDTLNITPGANRLYNNIVVKDLTAVIRRITFNSSGSLYCENIAIGSGGESIQSYSELIPRAIDGHLTIILENTALNLNRNNFRVGRPSNCHIFPLVNWVVERALPIVADIARSKIAEAINATIGDKASEIGKSFDQKLSASFALPVAQAPLPKFKATFNLFPQTITLSASRLTVVAGTNLRFEPGEANDAAENSEAQEMMLSAVLPSYVGLSQAFLSAALQEANLSGLFGINVSQATFPEYGDYLVAELIQVFIPDAVTRFPANAPISLQVTKAHNAKISVTEVDDGQIKLDLESLVIQIAVGGSPYLDLALNGAFNLRLALDPVSNKLALKAMGFEGLSAKGQFYSELNPKPQTAFDEKAFLDFVKMMEGLLLGEEGSPLLSLQLPTVAVGNRALRPTTAGVKDQYLLLGGKVSAL